MKFLQVLYMFKLGVSIICVHYMYTSDMQFVLFCTCAVKVLVMAVGLPTRTIILQFWKKAAAFPKMKSTVPSIEQL